MVAVYLTNSTLKAVDGQAGGRITARAVYETALPPGLLSSGVIVDAEALQGFIASFWDRHALPRKDVVLVLGGVQLSTRVVEVPAGLKEKELMEYLGREFTDLRHTEGVIGAWPMGRDKEHNRDLILATAAERSALLALTGVFEAAGIRLRDVCTGLNGALCLLARTPELRGQTCVVQMWDGASLMNILLVEGRYVYSSSTALSYDAGTPEFAVAVARQLSQLMRFMEAQHMTARVEQVYLAGVPDWDLGLYTESIYQISGTLEAAVLPASAAAGDKQSLGAFSQAPETMGALALRAGKGSLLRQLGRDAGAVEDRGKLKKRFLPVAVLFIAAVAVCLAVFGVERFYSARLSALLEYNNAEDVIQGVSEYDAVQSKNDAVQAALGAVTAAAGAIDSYPLPDSSVSATLRRCAAGLVAAELESYDAATGVLTMRATASDVGKINDFAAVLAAEDIFAGVDYSGYAYDTSIDAWTVNVICTLAADAGR